MKSHPTSPFSPPKLQIEKDECAFQWIHGCVSREAVRRKSSRMFFVDLFFAHPQYFPWWIHGTGIWTDVYHKFRWNVGQDTSPMEHVGVCCWKRISIWYPNIIRKAHCVMRVASRMDGSGIVTPNLHSWMEYFMECNSEQQLENLWKSSKLFPRRNHPNQCSNNEETLLALVSHVSSWVVCWKRDPAFIDCEIRYLHINEEVVQCHCSGSGKDGRDHTSPYKAIICIDDTYI